MDKYQANKYLHQFETHPPPNYQILGLINYGKSAAVFEAKDPDGNIVALKIFDNELVARYGQEEQLHRVNQETRLRDQSIPNLVRILDGGTFHTAAEEWLFVSMEYIEGQNLFDYLEANGPAELPFIQSLFSSLQAVTNGLLELDLVHRDIKPENIMVTEKGEIILMDLGVLKDLKGTNHTDHGNTRPFIGTLRYAPPEFLLREEKAEKAAYQAINLYQIGAVLHDAIMGKPIFSQYGEPYAKLVQVVIDENPIVRRSDLPEALLRFVRFALNKDWKVRIEKCQNPDLKELFPEEVLDPADKILNSLRNQSLSTSQMIEQAEETERVSLNFRDASREYRSTVIQALQDTLNSLKTHDLFREFEMQIHQSWCTVRILGELSHVFACPLYVYLRINTDHTTERLVINGFAKLKYSEDVTAKNRLESELRSVFKAGAQLPEQNIIDNIVYTEELDQCFEVPLLKILELARTKMQPTVNQILKQRQERAEALTNNRVVGSVRTIPPDIIIRAF